ncbi:hypothetical protein BH23PLA1_BH23PLA1_12350 [soil metagenome]
MIPLRSWLMVLAVVISGCGPSAQDLREETVSLLNTEADRWNGGEEFHSTAVDPYGHPVMSRVEKTTLNYVLEIRSQGPDGLPKNRDDIVVTRSRRHGETTLTKEAEKTVESLSAGATRGAIKGIKEGLKRSGGDQKKSED